MNGAIPASFEEMDKDISILSELYDPIIYDRSQELEKAHHPFTMIEIDSVREGHSTKIEWNFGAIPEPNTQFK